MGNKTYHADAHIAQHDTERHSILCRFPREVKRMFLLHAAYSGTSSNWPDFIHASKISMICRACFADVNLNLDWEI